MKALLGPFVLRRLKTEVAGQLTTKSHKVEFIVMTPEQSTLYESSVASMRSQINKKAAAAVNETGDKGVSARRQGAWLERRGEYCVLATAVMIRLRSPPTHGAVF